MHTTDTTARLALEFARKLHAALPTVQMALLVARNADETDPMVCHSHDFCDANMVMDEAMQRVLGRATRMPSDAEEGNCTQAESDADTTLWNTAWDQARLAGFDLTELARRAAEELAKRLAAKYPQKEVTVTLSDMYDENDNEVSKWVVAVTGEDREGVIDPFASCCGRFAVDPTEEWGIERADAMDMRQVNRQFLAVAEGREGGQPDAPRASVADSVFDNVVAAMQDAEEMGGPEGGEYITLMLRIAAEAQRRATNCAEAL
jgi:hypothetical protein